MPQSNVGYNLIAFYTGRMMRDIEFDWPPLTANKASNIQCCKRRGKLAYLSPLLYVTLLGGAPTLMNITIFSFTFLKTGNIAVHCTCILKTMSTISFVL